MVQDALPSPMSGAAPAPADTTVVLENLERTVDRIGEVRSLADLWDLAGDFQAELLRFGGRLVVAALVVLVSVAIYWVMARALRPIFERSRIQEDAAQLLTVILRYVVLKQAFQKIYPALSSQIVIVMLGSAVVSQISAEDLTYAANYIQSRNFRAFEVYLVVTLIYLLLAIALRAILRGIGRRAFPKA